jgi:hypothetical protein
MITARNGVDGKVCYQCKKWKGLQEFSPDRTQPESQGKRHGKCKKCHAEDARRYSAKIKQIMARLRDMGIAG